MVKVRWALLGSCLVLASCDKPTAFAPEIPPVNSAGPGQQYRLTGQLLSLQKGQAIAGATGQWAGYSTTPFLSDASGRFSVDASPGSLMFTIDAPGYLQRRSTLMVSGPRDNVTLDMISLEPPFSLAFYRQFARNHFENPLAYSHTNPWPVDPKFYIRTVTYDSAEVVPDEVIQGVRRVIEASVPELSGGRRRVAEFRSGPGVMPAAIGWVEVSFARQVGPDRVGEATLGYADGGRYMHLKYYGDPALSNSRRCEDAAVAIAEHEMVHMMGFFHTDQTGLAGSDFLSAGSGCPGSGRSARAVYHANIMYSRPRHNLDPDLDPPLLVSPSSVRESQVIRCRM